MPQRRELLRLALAALALPALAPGADIKDFAAAPHGYWTQPPKDRFTRTYERIRSGSLKLDETSPPSSPACSRRWRSP